MKEQIHKELANLQSELSRLSSAVKHIDEAKELADKVIKSTKEIEIKYQEQLQEVRSLTEAYGVLVDKTVLLTEKLDGIDFPGRLEGIYSAIGKTKESLEEFLDKNETFIKGTAESLNKQIQDIGSAIMEKSKEQAKDTDKQLSGIGDAVGQVKTEMESRFTDSRKDAKLLTVLVIVSIIISLTGLGLSIIL
jgi:DNA repair exonuclease SbcCD ATPase subunit